jgi:hypothetical protein
MSQLLVNAAYSNCLHDIYYGDNENLRNGLEDHYGDIVAARGQKSWSGLAGECQDKIRRDVVWALAEVFGDAVGQ